MINEPVHVFVITYRRHKLLKRAIESLITQSYENWVAEVINDDPFDKEVESIIGSFNDNRIFLKSHPENLGATKNFNYCFNKVIKEPYASILEDDNWWEKDFLTKMLFAIHNHPEVELAVSNEKIWIEQSNGSWFDSKRTIWPQKAGTEIFGFEYDEKCGSAKICNSSLLWKTRYSKNWLTPNDLPVDVSEHFRERTIPHPILLVNEPLVNFAQTLNTARSSKTDLWGSYQVLLIVSIFNTIGISEQKKLASLLWLKARSPSNGPYKTTLLNAALAHKSTRNILFSASLFEILRYCLTWLKRPVANYHVIKSIRNKKEHFQFLMDHTPTTFIK